MPIKLCRVNVGGTDEREIIVYVDDQSSGGDANVRIVRPESDFSKRTSLEGARSELENLAATSQDNRVAFLVDPAMRWNCAMEF